MDRFTPLFVCSRCEEESNCYPAEELMRLGDELICRECFACFTKVEIEDLPKWEPFVPDFQLEKSVMQAALWYFGNHLGPDVAEELRERLPEKIVSKLDLEAIENTNGEIRRAE